MAKRRRHRRRQPVPTVDYADPEGNVLSLRQSLSAGTIAKIGEAPPGAATSLDDAWRRRTEMLFERLAVRWEIAGLPLTEQAILLGRYRIADAETQRWVRETIAVHLERHIPELLAR
jgi:hypothetical protein